MSLKEVARTTLEILETGSYVNDAGETIDFRQEQQAAVAGTILYDPESGNALLATENPSGSSDLPVIEVTGETTQEAAKRLVQIEGCRDLVLLNFASARNPGGGFVNGAKAQEEDVCRCSGLYSCLLAQPRYYEANRAEVSLLYTDHIIYSPKVPFFRTRSRENNDRVFLASVITAPAPNAGQIIRRDRENWTDIERVLHHRSGIILAIARQHKHRNLLLGAWGCGVFRNQPSMVAEAFGSWLESPTFRGCFDRVTFAIYSRGKDDTLSAFQSRFPSL
jgi:uncharacterized protein (TIGR02452 family)